MGELISREMEAAEEAEDRERFLGVLAHDLRNPLGAASHAISFMLDSAAPDEQATRMLQVAQRSLSRMNGLIGQLLDFHRGRFGEGIRIRPERFDALQLVQDVAEGASINDRGISVRVGGEPGRVCWDRERMGQLLGNLIDNAVAHSPEQEDVEVTLARSGGEVELRVLNQGEPIPPERRKAIFRPFVRGQQDGGGESHVGLGLYISAVIVWAHGGTLRVETMDDGRTAFVVELPTGTGRAGI